MLKRVALCCALFLAGSAMPVLADQIGPGPSCSSCFGNSYTLTYATTAIPNVFDIKLVIDATGYLGNANNVLSDVAFKVTNLKSAFAVELVSAFGAIDAVQPGGLNAGGCDGAGAGFFCDAYVGSGHGLEVGHAGDVYEWMWALTLPQGLKDLFTGEDQASVKALYLTEKKDKKHDVWKSAGITSEDITLSLDKPTPNVVTPEPSSLFLLGTGLSMAAGLLRRRFHRSEVRG